MVLPLDVVEGAGGEDLHLGVVPQQFGDQPAVVLGAPGDLEPVALDHEAELQFCRSWSFAASRGCSLEAAQDVGFG